MLNPHIKALLSSQTLYKEDLFILNMLTPSTHSRSTYALVVNPISTGGGPRTEVHKVPEPANLVRRKYLKISLLAENVDQNPRVENTETFLSHVYFILTENLLYTLF